MKKFCLFCMVTTVVALNSFGFFICEKCGHEVDDEPVKTTTEKPLGLKVNEVIGTATASGVSLSSLPSTITDSAISWPPQT